MMNMLNDYMNTHLNIGSHILHLFYHMVAQSVVCLSLVFLNYIEDTAEGLVKTFRDSLVVNARWRCWYRLWYSCADDKSTGVMPHLKTYDASSLAYRQGKTRRGSYAAYLDISHPDIMMFLEMRKPTGDPNMRC
jgi:ribonucleoside-diphosphate reductase alpha chain